MFAVPPAPLTLWWLNPFLQVHQRSAHGSFTSRPTFEKIPGLEMSVNPLDISLVSSTQCLNKIPFGYRPIYEIILEAELSADSLDVRYYSVPTHQVLTSQTRWAQLASDTVPVQKARWRKLCHMLERWPSIVGNLEVCSPETTSHPAPRSDRTRYSSSLNTLHVYISYLVWE